MGIPHTLEALGVSSDRFDELAAMAVVDPTADGNPVPLDLAGARRLLDDAYSGTGI
jgi:alcohol dehydrogenase class IV